jgi:L-iditol 2-dehydrogenase
MKAMRLTGIRKMEMLEVDKPQIIADNDVLIKMTDVGVCGSDVHYYTRGKIGSQVVEYPFTVGHEGSGIVEAVGSAVTRVKPGDAIAIEPATCCHHCDQCLAGREHTCRNLTFLGCPDKSRDV